MTQAPVLPEDEPEPLVLDDEPPLESVEAPLVPGPLDAPLDVPVPVDPDADDAELDVPPVEELLPTVAEEPLDPVEAAEDVPAAPLPEPSDAPLWVRLSREQPQSAESTPATSSARPAPDAAFELGTPQLPGSGADSSLAAGSP